MCVCVCVCVREGGMGWIGEGTSKFFWPNGCTLVSYRPLEF